MRWKYMYDRTGDGNFDRRSPGPCGAEPSHSWIRRQDGMERCERCGVCRRS